MNRLQQIDKYLQENYAFAWIRTTPDYIEYKSQYVLLHIHKDAVRCRFFSCLIL